MLKKIQTTLSFLFLFFILISISKAEILKPNSNIKPSDVVKIQLIGLQNNNDEFEDSGIEQTWNFAHPNNKKATGPLDKFKRMIKSNNYQMMINHISHTITEIRGGDNWVQFEVIILDNKKIYHKFNWQVEKYTEDGPLKDCWLTTMVSSPVSLGSSI
ncbi:hypothetical protein IDH15_01635 [Pelagibacterales bacterium SAG-MED38]|nr:hypothetical protein [Pelagibacterales bacterium SAG-MED38]